MLPHRVARTYQGVIDGTHLALETGAMLMVSPEDAAKINADQPGTLEEPESHAARALDAPPRDRMARRGAVRTEGPR